MNTQRFAIDGFAATNTGNVRSTTLAVAFEGYRCIGNRRRYRQGPEIEDNFTADPHRDAGLRKPSDTA